LARAVDVYVTFVLSEAVYRAQLEKKKRITVSHLGLSNEVVPVPVVDDKDGDENVVVNDATDKPALKKATRKKGDVKVEGIIEAKVAQPTVDAVTPKPIDNKPIDTKPIDNKPIDTKPIDTVDAVPVPAKKGRKAAAKVVAEVSESIVSEAAEAASVVAPLPVFSQVSCDGGSCSVVSTIIDEHQPIKPAVKRKRTAPVDSNDGQTPAAKKRAVKAK
jgi:hypothetical protein